MRPPPLRVEALSFQYRTGAQALREVSCTLAPGELVGMIGPSGAGKSTFGLLVNGLIPHLVRGTMTGRVEVLGRDTCTARVWELAPLAGLLFQDFEAQLFSSTVLLEVAFGLENLGLPPPEIKRRAMGALTAVGLTGLERRAPGTLSGGEKQRLALACLLAMEPPLLVLDEPTTDLDPQGRAALFTLLAELRRDQGRALLLIEQEPDPLVEVDRLLLMADGVLLAEGPPTSLLRDPAVLQRAGLPLPPIVECFFRLKECGLLGSAEPHPPALPLTAHEGIALLRHLGRQALPDAASRLARQDAVRAGGYGEVLVDAEGVGYRYPGAPVPALRGVSLQLRRGEFVAIVGQNGSGKTTLLKHLNGLLHPTAGRVRVAGLDTRSTEVSDLSRHVGYVSQNPDHLLFAPRIADDVAFGPRLRGMPESEVARRVQEALAAVALEARGDEDPFVLTKGVRQSVAVAAALATRPELLLLDEPTTGLDPHELTGMMALLDRLNAAGHTLVIVTHHMGVVAAHAHRTIVLKDGQIIFDGPTRDAFGQDTLLTEAGLEAPPLVRLGRALGVTMLCVNEVVQCLAGNAP